MIRYIEVVNVGIAHDLVNAIQNEIVHQHEPEIFEPGRILDVKMTESEESLMDCLYKAKLSLNEALEIIRTAGSTLYARSDEDMYDQQGMGKLIMMWKFRLNNITSGAIG